MALNRQIEQTDPKDQNNSTQTARRARKPRPEAGIGLTFAEPETAPNPEPTTWLSPELQNQLGPDSLVFQSWQDHSNRKPPSRKGFAKPESMRKYPKLAEARDFEGRLWDVRGIRPTKHGFDLLYGTRSPAGSHCGVPRLIPTRELLEFWDDNRTQLRLVYDLPAGRSTIKRMWQEFEFNVNNDTSEFYAARILDLEVLTAREFAAKHGVAIDVARQRRHRIFGNSTRPLGWWRKPMFLKFLLSDMTLINVAGKLGIGTTHASRLRRQAKQELQSQLPLAA